MLEIVSCLAGVADDGVVAGEAASWAGGGAISVASFDLSLRRLAKRFMVSVIGVQKLVRRKTMSSWARPIRILELAMAIYYLGGRNPIESPRPNRTGKKQPKPEKDRISGDGKGGNSV